MSYWEQVTVYSFIKIQKLAVTPTELKPATTMLHSQPVTSTVRETLPNLPLWNGARWYTLCYTTHKMYIVWNQNAELLCLLRSLHLAAQAMPISPDFILHVTPMRPLQCSYLRDLGTSRNRQASNQCIYSTQPRTLWWLVECRCRGSFWLLCWCWAAAASGC